MTFLLNSWFRSNLTYSFIQIFFTLDYYFYSFLFSVSFFMISFFLVLTKEGGVGEIKYVFSFNFMHFNVF
jgi:hypothetical protein